MTLMLSSLISSRVAIVLISNRFPKRIGMPKPLEANFLAACKIRASFPSGKTTLLGWRTKRLTKIID